MPWVAKFDDTGPQNGDVIVSTQSGRLVALIYAAVTPQETMRRAEAVLRADPARKPIGELTSAEMLSLSPNERALAVEALACAHEASMSSCGIKVCMDCGAPLNAKAKKLAQVSA